MTNQKSAKSKKTSQKKASKKEFRDYRPLKHLRKSLEKSIDKKDTLSRL